MVWSQLELQKPHIAYACIGIFTTIFSLVSLFVKEKLYIGEATVAAITGLILGPHCLGWFEPTSWGNSDYITLEISRIVLCVQIFAVAVELPKKYMLKHWISVFVLLVPVMTCGWLIVGLFLWLLIPGLNFSACLLIAACVTATDPVLAAAVVGKGKFAERVPGHLRNLLSAESGCNDGMAFPFIYLSLNLVLHPHNPGEIIKDWILITILWECIFGCILGAVIGYLGRHAIKYAESKDLIDRESFLAFYIVLAFTCAGVGSMLGVDDLLVSFAAGAAFAWNGWFAKKTEETHVSTVIDLLLNLAYFVYFGAIIPWEQFNNGLIGLNAWRLVVMAFVVIFLRRIPAVMALKPLTPDIKTWREALFCGHFGPIGVGAVFAAILARKELEGAVSDEETPLRHLPPPDSPHYQLMATIWPVVTFIIIVSIIVHGSSVAVMTLGRHLNTMSITMSFTQTQGNGNSQSWMSRLPKLETSGRSFSLHRIDTQNTQSTADGTLGPLSQSNTVETSGIPYRPAGGMQRRGKRSRKNKTIGERVRPRETQIDLSKNLRERPISQSLQLNGKPSSDLEDESGSSPTTVHVDEKLALSETGTGTGTDVNSPETEKIRDQASMSDQTPVTAIQEGNDLILEDRDGEVIETIKYQGKNKTPQKPAKKPITTDMGSIHSITSLRNRLHKYASQTESENSLIGKLDGDEGLEHFTANASNPKVIVKRGEREGGARRKLFAFKLDDQIIVENEEGEIVRRYRVNHHGTELKGVANRARSNSVMGGLNKALSFVGFKGRGSVSGAQSGTTSSADMESNQKTNTVLIPEYADDISIAPQFEKRIEGHLQSMLNFRTPVPKQGRQDDNESENQGPLSKPMAAKDLRSTTTEARHQTVDSEEEDSEEEDSEEEDDDREYDEDGDDGDDGEEDSDMDSDFEETEVERVRRLAALGTYRAPRDSDDEED